MRSRSLVLVALAVAGASMAGMALTGGAWRLLFGAVTLAAAGAFGGRLDGTSRAWLRTILLLGLLAYLVIVPTVGFVTRALEELGTPVPQGVLVVLAGLDLGAAFFATRASLLRQRDAGLTR